jgi:hypothetical protein
MIDNCHCHPTSSDFVLYVVRCSWNLSNHRAAPTAKYRFGRFTDSPNTFRSKVIGLDDLLLDYLQSGKKDKVKVKAAKSKHGSKGGYDSGEEDDKATQQEIAVCKIFEEVQQKVIYRLPQPLLLLPVPSCLFRI